MYRETESSRCSGPNRSRWRQRAFMRWSRLHAHAQVQFVADMAITHCRHITASGRIARLLEGSALRWVVGARA